VISNTESFLNNAILKKKTFLFYGENRELIEQLNRKIIDQNKNYTKKILYNDDIVKNLEQINDLINVNNIFGEKFLIIIKNLSESTFTQIRGLFKNIGEYSIILNCDLLKRNSKIRLEFENSKDAIVVPCYNDSEKELFSFLHQALKQKRINLNVDELSILQTKKNLNRSKIIEILSKLEILNESKTTITTNILESICNDHGYLDNEEFSLLSNTNQQEIENFLNSTHNPLENVIILKNTIFRILKIIDFSKEKNPIEALEYYRPSIFWKEKEKLKKILKLWKIEDLKKLIIKLNNLETNLKRNYDNSELYQNNFFTNELFKKTFKSGNNFI